MYLTNSFIVGRPVALDITVVASLNLSTLAEAGTMVGSVLEEANDEKCLALGYVSTSLAIDSYGAWSSNFLTLVRMRFLELCCYAAG